MQKQELSTLSLARRAGKLVLGFDKVVEEMRAGKGKGRFLQRRPFRKKPQGAFLCGTKNFACSPLLWMYRWRRSRQACGKRSGVIAVCDEGFAKKLSALAQQRTGQKHS